MATVVYSHQFEYGYDEDGGRTPFLSFRVSSPENASPPMDVDFAIDSGAERSLIDGQVGTSIGLNLLDGTRLNFETMAGSVFPATLHEIQLSHPDLGTFRLEVAFSLSEIRRNLLGRDFFDLAQIGFRERYLTLFVTPEP